jgi:hypothetical protein
VLTTSNGYNWAAIYSPPANAAGHFIDPIHHPYFDRVRVLQFDEIAWNDKLSEIGETELRRDPALLARVVRRNAEAFFEVRPRLNRSAETLDGRSLTVRSATLWIFYLEFVCGVAGLWLNRGRPIVRLMTLLAAYFSFASLLFIAAPRLRAPVDLTLAVGCGLLAERLIAHRPDRQQGATPVLRSARAEPASRQA